jgi:hypothetical protein
MELGYLWRVHSGRGQYGIALFFGVSQLPQIKIVF